LKNQLIKISEAYIWLLALRHYSRARFAPFCMEKQRVRERKISCIHIPSGASVLCSRGTRSRSLACARPRHEQKAAERTSTFCCALFYGNAFVYTRALLSLSLSFHLKVRGIMRCVSQRHVCVAPPTPPPVNHDTFCTPQCNNLTSADAQVHVQHVYRVRDELKCRVDSDSSKFNGSAIYTSACALNKSRRTHNTEQ